MLSSNEMTVEIIEGMQNLNPSQNEWIKVTNDWLVSRNQKSLDFKETICLLLRMLKILESIIYPENFKEKLAICVAKSVCEFRGYPIHSDEEIKNHIKEYYERSNQTRFSTR